MAPKKSTEQQTTVAASPAVASTPSSVPSSVPAPVAEKAKKSKKTEQAPVVAALPVEAVAPVAPVTEKAKKSKKTEQAPVVASEPVVQSTSESEKPKKTSRKKVKSEETTESQNVVTSEPLQSTSESEKPKKRVKSVKSVKSEEPQSETSSTESSEQASETPEKRVRKVVNQETLKADVEQLKQQVEAEIQRLRSDQQKNKGVKFLKAVNKSLKTLGGDLNRVLKSKTKSTRNKNTSSGFMKPVKISTEMSSFTDWDPSMLYSRVDVTKFLCNYIKTNSLQNPEDKRQILCDEKLATLLKVDVTSDRPLTYPGLQQHIQQHFLSQSSSVSEEVAQP